ncbi:MAG: right-handed parallel beta-helix repeat-containing protein [Saprospiraceae bacterium]|nr:right-handed parallel beta-helix repeat-containing protein [Saprospiraceae bacterium]
MRLSLLYIPLILLLSCGETEVSDHQHALHFGPGQEDDIRRAFIQIEDSTEIVFDAGTYRFEKLSLKGKLKKVTLRGAGQDQTIFDFSTQDQGGEGLRIDYVEDLEISGMTFQESPGDLLKMTECSNVLIKDVGTIWAGEPDSANGGYGIYPVLCHDVTIENSYARGASDAGIYVGQTVGAIVRNCKAEYNVAGIEIENTKDAQVYDNESCHNTGGLLIFDLPGLKYDGENTVAYNNYIHDNNHRNFARSSNSVSGVGNVPPGTGVMILRTSNLEVKENRIENNNTMSLGILSYVTVDPNILATKPDWDPVPRNIKIHGNDISKADAFPKDAYIHNGAQQIIQLQEGLVAAGSPMTSIAPILYDGITMAEGTNPANICIDEEGDGFLNMDAGANFANPSYDVSPFICDPE